MSNPSIIIDPNEAHDIEKNLILREIYYRPTGYFSNAKTLRDTCKKKGYKFKLSEIKKWLTNQSEWQKYVPSPKNILRVSYGKISRPNCVHQADILFLTHDRYKSKKWIAVLNIIDVASRFKASVPLMSKKSSEVAKAFRKIYDDSRNPLTYPRLLQCDGGTEFKKSVSQLMEAHNVTIRIIGPYSHRGMAIVERFNQTLSEMLYKIQYAVESITSNPKLIREWVKYLPEVIDYLHNYLTRLIRAPGPSN